MRCLGGTLSGKRNNEKGQQMNITMLLRGGSTVVAMLVCNLSYATSYGNNVTIPDNVAGSGTTFGSLHGQAGEDNETEPNTVAGQVWDLEAFMLKNGSALSIVGGYNFKTGQSYGGMTYYAGDVFIAASTPVYGAAAPSLSGGSGYNTIQNASYKYDYVIVFDRTNPGNAGGSALDEVNGKIGYKVYKLNNESELSAYYRQNDDSNPFRLKIPTSATELTAAAGSVTVALDNSLDSTQGGQFYGYGGNNSHYVLSGIDLGFLTTGYYWFHTTYGCGNDSIMGYGHVPDGGMTLAMLGMGIGTLALVGRRLRK